MTNCNIMDLNNTAYRYLAIDETDRMGEKGHFEELQKLLEMVRAESKEGNRQHFVMSATLSLVHRPPTYNKGVYICKIITN